LINARVQHIPSFKYNCIPYSFFVSYQDLIVLKTCNVHNFFEFGSKFANMNIISEKCDEPIEMGEQLYRKKRARIAEENH